MHGTDDAAQHQYMHKRMMRREIPGRHLQPFFLRVIDEKSRIYRQQYRQPAQKHKTKHQDVHIFDCP